MSCVSIVVTRYLSRSSALAIIAPVESEIGRSELVPPISTATRSFRSEAGNSVTLCLSLNALAAGVQTLLLALEYRPHRERGPDRPAERGRRGRREDRPCSARSARASPASLAGRFAQCCRRSRR